MFGHLNNVSILIELGAEIDAVNDEGKTAMDLAVEKGYKDIIHLLQTKKRMFGNSNNLVL